MIRYEIMAYVFLYCLTILLLSGSGVLGVLLRKETEQKPREVDLFDECLWHDKRVRIGLEYPVASDWNAMNEI